MATPPPIPPRPPPLPATRLPPVVVPPPVVALYPTEDLGRYLNRCSVVCLIVAGFLALVIPFGIHEVATKRTVEDVATLVFVFCGVGTAAAAGVLLRKRKKSAYPCAMLIFVPMLLGCPGGTVLGIFAIKWLNKGQALLK